MRKAVLLSLLVIVTLINFGGVVEPSSSVQALTDIHHRIPLRVVFVGFDQGSVDVPLINSSVSQSHVISEGNFTVSYALNLSYHFANTSYYETLRTFVLAHSVNGSATTSAVNETALQHQRATGEKMSIFLPQSGRAIDAAAVEDWFTVNPYLAYSDPTYWFYVVNFTEFDSPDHSIEHWYNVSELDFESDVERDFWRLEWDNTLNPDVQFPYACFTSDSRVFFIDPSAFQWYLTWARIWWGLSVSGPKYDYYYEDLDEFLQTHDVGTSPGRTALAYYLAGWIEDGIVNLLLPDLWTSVNLSEARSMSIQALVLNNASDAGYTNEAMAWIINTTLVELAIEGLAPFIDVEVQVDFVNLTDYDVLEAIFDGAVIEVTDGWTFYDGEAIWDALYSLRETYFDFAAADLVINSYVYLEKNMSMMVYGGEYTGLGGSGQILVMKEVGRYYQEDGISPKSGLGLVFIHEAGHNLGFPHTFIHGVAYASDFAFDVMGYYPYSFFFTQLRSDCFRRLIVDYKILALQQIMEEDALLYGRKNSTSIIDAEFNAVIAEIDGAVQLHDQLAYLDAHNAIVAAADSETRLRELIWIYLCDFDDDCDVDIFDIVVIAAAYGSQLGDPYWIPMVDLIQDDIIDIYDIVIAADNYGENWCG